MKRTKPSLKSRRVQALIDLMADPTNAMTQAQMADALGVSTRTVRRWKRLPGFGDALWVWDGITVMVEYKSASGELTPDEKRFRDAWPGPYAVIRSEWDAVELRERLLDDEREIEV